MGNIEETLKWSGPMEMSLKNNTLSLYGRGGTNNTIANHVQKKVSNIKGFELIRGKAYPNHTAQKLQIDPCLIMKELKEAYSFVTRVL